MQNLDFGIPITYYASTQFPSFTIISGLFVGITNGEVTSVILAKDLKPEILKAPAFDAHAFTNVGILSQNFNYFNKILRRFTPKYFKNTYADLITKGCFQFSAKADHYYDPLTNNVRLAILLPDIPNSLFLPIPGYSLCESQGIEDFILPDYSNFPLDKGNVLFDGEYRLTFMDWYNDHIGEKELREAVIYYVRRVNESATIKINLKGKRRRAS